MFLRYTSSLAPTFTLALHTVRWSSTFSLPETPLYVTFENCTVIEKFGREEHVDLPDFSFTGAMCYRLRRKIENKTIPTDCSFVCLFIKAINSQQFIVNSKHEEVSRPLFRLCSGILPYTGSCKSRIINSKLKGDPDIMKQTRSVYA